MSPPPTLLLLGEILYIACPFPSHFCQMCPEIIVCKIARMFSLAGSAVFSDIFCHYATVTISIASLDGQLANGEAH